jgi:hypothetical protein
MPIQPFLCGQAFNPEMIREMSEALESVCRTMGLRMVHDNATRLIAAKIIQLAEWGIRDAPTLRDMALKEFREVK